MLEVDNEKINWSLCFHSFKGKQSRVGGLMSERFKVFSEQLKFVKLHICLIYMGVSLLRTLLVVYTDYC